MPRGSNRVGVEVEPLPQQHAADLLKAKKAERRARARRRAEEKKLKDASFEHQATSPEHDLSEQAKTRLGDSEKNDDSQGSPTHQAAAEADALSDSTLQRRREQQQSSVGGDLTGASSGSSLEQARAEYGTEEVLDVDAYVAALNSELQREAQAFPAVVAAVSAAGEQQATVALPAQTPALPPPREDGSATPKLTKKRGSDKRARSAEKLPSDSPAATRDVAAKRIQKALKRKFLKKTLKKCASFLRHSSKVFADVPAAPAGSSSQAGRIESPQQLKWQQRRASVVVEFVEFVEATSDLQAAEAVELQQQPSGQDDSSTTEAKTNAATKIQAWLRGVGGRRRAHIRRIEFDREMESEALCEVHAEASVRIQAIVRGFLTRQRLDIGSGAPSSLTRSDRSKPKAKKKKRNRRRSISAFFKGRDGTSDDRAATVSDASLRGEDDEETGESEERATRSSPKDLDAPDQVAEWPTEFNLEGLDAWDELNSVANVRGDLVTHAHFLSKSRLRVFCGTWNMHAKKPQDDLRLWIPLNKYHVVAVGSEECVNSIAKSVVFTSKKQWESLLKDALGDEYVLVASHSLTAIHNIVFVHESVIPLLSNIQSDAVATGLGNQLGNKGGVGIAFSLGRTSFAFVNCHFDAHQHNTEKRNGNFHRINQELRLFPLSTSSATSSALTPSSAAVTGESSLDGLGKTTATRFSLSSASPSNSGSQQPGGAGGGVAGKKRAISESFDRVFWFGDLNYRVNGTRRMVDLLLLRNQHDVLRFNDQLQIEMTKGNVFAHFREGPLHFRPTYKFDKRSNVYDSSAKQRIPSWTDRILFLSNDKLTDIEILSYRSQMSFQTSDHRPVGAAFQVAFRSASNHRGASVGGTGGVSGSDQEFARVLARGYKPNQAKSEVCAIQ